MKLTIGEISPGTKFVGVILIALLIVVGYYQLIFVAQEAQIAEIEKEIQSKQKEISRVTDVKRQHPNWDAYESDLRNKMVAINKLIPDTMEMPFMVTELDKVAGTKDLVLVGVRYTKAVDKKQYQAVGMELKVSGSFNGVIDYINRLENLERLNRINGIEITTRENNPGQLHVTINTNMYVFGGPQNLKQITLVSKSDNQKPVAQPLQPISPSPVPVTQ